MLPSYHSGLPLLALLGVDRTESPISITSLFADGDVVGKIMRRDAA